MRLFRPTDIKIILVLSLLVLVGSVLTLLKRQRIISRLDLGIFARESPYKYSYDEDDLARLAPADSSSEKAITPAVSDSSREPGRIDINRAGFYDLQALPGIGPAIAERIIAYRDSAGDFESVEELMKINGIGPAKLEKLKDRAEIR
jgi:comEA protein